MSDLRADVRDLHKWGNPPSEIARILRVRVKHVESILITLGLVKPPQKRAARPVPVMSRERIDKLRTLDAEIKFYEARLSSLKQYRVTLSNLEQSGANLAQKINEARR